MALGIYKPGQGYWVRVLTATFAGVLLLAASAWLWGQLETASGVIPISHWEMTLRPAEGSAAPGDRLVLMGEPPQVGDPAPQIGEGVVRVAEPGTLGVRLEIEKVEMRANRDPTQVRSIAPSEASGATLEGGVIAVRTERLFETMLLQAAGVGLLILIGAGFIYYYVGARPGSAEFLIATDGEMKKVNWSTRRDIAGSTMIVIVWAFMIAAGLFVVDLAFSKFFQLVGVLEG